MTLDDHGFFKLIIPFENNKQPSFAIGILAYRYIISFSEMVQDIEQEHKNHDHDDKDTGSGGPTVVVDVRTEENNNGISC